MRITNLVSKKRFIYFGLVSFILLSALTSAKLFISYYSTGNAAQVALAKQYIGIAEGIAKGLDKDIYERFLLTKQRDENREKITLYLEQYRTRINALYVYILLLDESDVAKVMVGATPPEMENFPIGELCTTPVIQVNQAKQGGNYYTGIIKDENHGSYLSIGVPFYDNDGQILGVVGIDIDAKDLEHLSQQVLRSNVFIFGIDILFALILIIAIFFLRMWYKRQLTRELKESEVVYISELGKVIDTIKSSRHDMMNHLNVLSGLIEMSLFDEVSDYLKRLKFDSNTLDLSIRIKNPILMVLFQSKWEFAHFKNIQMIFEADLNDFSRVESMDLVKIYSNLLDNAIEAVDSYPGEKPAVIRVICKTIGDMYVFAVENPARLTLKERNSLFQYGYTTKESIESMRGNGLTIVKRTVEKYQGDIYFQVDEDKVFIQITI